MDNSLKPYISRALQSALQPSEAEDAFDIIMSGRATQAQIGAFLMILRLRGESIEEITAAAKIMRSKTTPVSVPDKAIDIVGTGGDGKSSLNISTAAALVVVGAGVPVAKHGNKALSSKSGSTDVLSQLGISIDAAPNDVEQALRENGFGYMNAPNYHSAMRHVSSARAELGTRTVFNILGPLTNPGFVKRQLVGSFSKALIKPMADTLHSLGSDRAWVVHGEDGTDEISISGRTFVASLDNGSVTEFVVTPSDAGLSYYPFGEILGGAPEFNAQKIVKLLDGDTSSDIAAYREAVILNAAASLLIAGAVTSLPDGAAMAASSLDNGLAKAKLEALRS